MKSEICPGSSESESESHSAVSDSLQPHGVYSPWNSPGQNTGVGSLSLLQRIFPTQELDPGLPHCGQILYQLSHQGSPRILEWVACPFFSGSSWPKNQTWVSCIAGGFFINWATSEAPIIWVCPISSLEPLKSEQFLLLEEGRNEAVKRWQVWSVGRTPPALVCCEDREGRCWKMQVNWGRPPYWQAPGTLGLELLELNSAHTVAEFGKRFVRRDPERSRELPEPWMWPCVT